MPKPKTACCAPRGQGGIVSWPGCPRRSTAASSPACKSSPWRLKHVLYEARGVHRLRLLPELGCRLGSDRDGRRQGHRASDDRGRGHGGPTASRWGRDTSQPGYRAGISGRSPADKLRTSAWEVVDRDSPCAGCWSLYHTAFLTQVSQAVACNGLHSVHCRLLPRPLTTQERVDSDVFPMTHEFLAEMLGVRRSTVSEVLEPFQENELLILVQAEEMQLSLTRTARTAWILRVLPGISEEFETLVRIEHAWKTHHR